MCTSTLAFWARRMGGVSAEGEALHMLPTMVALARICVEATTLAAWATAELCSLTMGEVSISLRVVNAPMCRPVSSSHRMYFSPSMRFRSIR